MIQKYFPLDKNYILEKAQLDLEQELITYLISFAKQFYLDQYNPLGLEDDTVRMIKGHKAVFTGRLKEFYRNLAGVYRYIHGNNQLELLFDGQDHYNKYTADWKITFKEWLVDFCFRPNFLRAVLELTVFYPKEKKAALAENRMKAFVHQHFELKIYKHKGIIKSRTA